MNIKLNNAKANLKQNFLFLDVFFPKIDIVFCNEFIFFFKTNSNELILKISYDSSYLLRNENLDYRYFNELFVTSFKKINKNALGWNIRIKPLQSWYLLLQNKNDCFLTANHHERELILLFLESFHVNINDYEFFFKLEKNKLFAIKKSFLENLNNAFIGIKLVKSLQFIF